MSSFLMDKIEHNYSLFSSWFLIVSGKISDMLIKTLFICFILELIFYLYINVNVVVMSFHEFPLRSDVFINCL